MNEVLDRARREALKWLGGLSLTSTLGSVRANSPVDGSEKPLPATGSRISAIDTDRAAYTPGHPVIIEVRLALGFARPAGWRVVLRFRHLQALLPGELSTIVPEGDGPATMRLRWQPPAIDFRGYTIEAELVDAQGAPIDAGTSAVDVSSSWTKFPRYGYLTDYAGIHGAESFIEPLNALHINALQFYDWQWKHHQPIKGEPGKADPEWPELSNRPVRRAALQGLIAAAHAKGMVAMQYNLIYGAAADFEASGVDPAWRLFDKPGGDAWRFGPFPNGWTTPYLYIFNPANPGWQQYILQRELEVFQTFDFDGWHADTVGDWGLKYDEFGRPVDIKATFKPFLQATRSKLGQRPLVMNAVGGKGRTEVHTSPIDVPYIEVWPWDGFPDYKSLKDLIDSTRAETGGKSLVVPAYMNYEYGKKHSDSNPGRFNDAGVLLTEATVMAAGGVRFELGDGGRMLSHEYFPIRSLVMGSSLKAAIQRYWDFLVAYQNLLRDGQEDVPHRVATETETISIDGRKDTVWAYARQDPAGREVVHFINLLGVRHTSWRDDEADQHAPRELRSLQVKLYAPTTAEEAFFASPDHAQGRAQHLQLTRGRDADGPFVQFTLPLLRYWSMVWMSAR
jgi:dextranase